MTKNILLTGTAGFIGSNFVPYFLEKYPEYNLINLDLLTYAGNLENLKECEGNPRYKFIKGDICNRELVEFIFNEYDINGVIHFAAESHVDNSIKNPGVFVETNVNGTFTLLDVARAYWMEKPFTYKEKYLGCAPSGAPSEAKATHPGTVSGCAPSGAPSDVEEVTGEVGFCTWI